MPDFEGRVNITKNRQAIIVLDGESGEVGIGTADPQRTIEIGQDDVAGISLEGFAASPHAGVIRFGDNTGWKVHIGRSREAAGGALNIGTSGLLMTIQDNGNVGIGTTAPQRKLEIGQNDVAGISFEGFTTSPHSGAIRFGDNTGWKLHIGRSREAAGESLNSGTAGLLMTIQDDGNVFFYRSDGVATVHIDSNTGDIVLANADCAEEFAVDTSQALEPGMVMVIGENDTLYPCNNAYDKRVAGVISGAGGCRPAIVLGRQPSPLQRLPLALSGKVYCKVDAQCSPIDTGDLLTTSPTPGHAMKAVDSQQAFGAVIGKALRPLREGQGLIPILIALQ